MHCSFMKNVSPILEKLERIDLKTIGIIPARMESSRFPGKPLRKIHGMPMIGHVYKRSEFSSLIDELYVATCNVEIKKYIESIGGKAIMTSSEHERASDRTAEALEIIESDNNCNYEIIVMIQGDEPMITSKMIDSAIEPLKNDKSILISNLITKINSKEEWEDYNEVKVVFDKNLFALYFSREPIPSSKKYLDKISPFKQVCVIPFRKECLLRYNSLEPTELEIIESIDMNRLLENNIKIKLVKSNENTYAVDTEDDLKNVQLKMESDILLKKYL